MVEQSERLRRRLELRRSNACVPHRNRYREAQSGEAPWDAEDFRDMSVGEDFEDLRESSKAPAKAAVAHCDTCGRRLHYGLCEFCDPETA